MTTPCPHCGAEAGDPGYRRVDSGNHIAMVVIPTASLAAEEGMSFPQWDGWRRGELVIVGTAIRELRAAGWVLEVTHRAAPTPDCDTLIPVEARDSGRAA